jgi:hypothetical protein
VHKLDIHHTLAIIMVILEEGGLVITCLKNLLWCDSFHKVASVATLALGSRPRQGVARLRAKKETQESHHMLPGMQRV